MVAAAGIRFSNINISRMRSKIKSYKAERCILLRTIDWYTGYHYILRERKKYSILNSEWLKGILALGTASGEIWFSWYHLGGSYANWVDHIHAVILIHHPNPKNGVSTYLRISVPVLFVIFFFRKWAQLSCQRRRDHELSKRSQPFLLFSPWWSTHSRFTKFAGLAGFCISS